ncbi:MAG TPA: PP2C family protein-serine/threonine phosphatase [Polyangiaceae bacterium]
MQKSYTRTTEGKRAREIFEERYDAHLRRTDRLFAYLMLGQWAAAILIAVVLSPYAWRGKTHVVHEHVYVAVVLGALISAMPVTLAFVRPGWVGTRMVIACAQMLWSALLIHLSGGRIETHFHVFGSLAFLAFYRDWRVYVPATVVVAADHLLRQMYWPESVYGILAPESWRFLEHAFWVVFEDVFLILSCIQSVREMRQNAAQQAHSEFTERLEHEMQIASNIQTALLPREIRVPGTEIAAKMVPATEVGGDYYDVVHADKGCFIGIGDVAGHGLKAGLMMLQAQSTIEALVRGRPGASPRDILTDANRVVFGSSRGRLGAHEHMTISLVRYHDDGRFVMAGAHEEALVWRAATGRCERLWVGGTWLGMVEDITSETVEKSFDLAEDDLLVLYTDGLTEAANGAGEQLGLDRLSAAVEKVARAPVEEVCDYLVALATKWAGGRQEDDLTVVVLRHVGLARQAAA